MGSSVDVWGEVKYLEAFNEIPELNAILNLKARCFANGTIKALDKSGKEVDKVPQCLKNPNWFQEQKEFLRQTKLFHEIYGDEYLYMLFGVGMKDITGAKALFTLPPNLVECEYLESQPFFVFSEQPENIEYSLVDGGRIPTDQIIHMNDNRVTVKEANGKHILKGESKMKGLKVAINNIRMAYESRGIILKNRGAQGILSNATSDVAGTVPLDPKERERVQNEYKNYGVLGDQNQLIITSQNLKWQKMGINPSDLGLFQETEQDFFKMCDSYGTPIDLFASVKGSTFENQRQAEKGLYVRTIIPEANEWINSVGKALLEDESITLIMDFSHLAIFQEDLKSRGDALTSLTNALSKALSDGAITIDEYKEELIKHGLGKQKANG